MDLSLIIISGVILNLKDQPVKGADAYVFVSVGAQAGKTSTHKSCGGYPIWNYAQNFTVNEYDTLKFQIKEKDMIKDDLMAEVTLLVSSIRFQNNKATKIDFQNTKYKGSLTLKVYVKDFDVNTQTNSAFSNNGLPTPFDNIHGKNQNVNFPQNNINNGQVPNNGYNQNFNNGKNHAFNNGPNAGFINDKNQQFNNVRNVGFINDQNRPSNNAWTPELIKAYNQGFKNGQDKAITYNQNQPFNNNFMPAFTKDHNPQPNNAFNSAFKQNSNQAFTHGFNSPLSNNKSSPLDYPEESQHNGYKSIEFDKIKNIPLYYVPSSADGKLPRGAVPIHVNKNQ